MKNNTNIYDIDGELIRRFEDVHRFTALEATKIHEKYTKKIQDLKLKSELTAEDEKKIRIYETYCKNLQHYIYVEMQGMTKEELEEYYKAIIPEKPAETSKEDIEKALNEVRNDVEIGINPEDEVHKDSPDDNEDDRDGIFGDDAIVRREPCDIPERLSVTQDDLLVEREGVINNMDEYVSPIDEASDEYVQPIEYEE